VELYGGENSAVTAVSADETAFAQRAILFTIQVSEPVSSKALSITLLSLTLSVFDKNNFPKVLRFIE
jgi:hypothetical protein